MSNTTNSGLQIKPTASTASILVPLIAIIVGMFMVLLDSTAINVAVPILVQEFNSSLAVVQWTVAGYFLAEAAVIPLAGWLSDRFGADRLFLVSVGLFTVASLLCAVASSAEQLITYRIIQGMGGGMVMPLAMMMVFRLSPPGKVGTVMGLLGVPTLIAPALAPVLAGWLVDFASWRYIFVINIPIGIIAIIIGLRRLPKFPRQPSVSLDTAGMLLGPLAFAALIYGVNQGGDTGWDSARSIIGLSVGAIALILFIVTQLRKSDPLLDLRVFRSLQFTRAAIIQSILAIAYFGILFLIPVYLQQVQGISAFYTGLLMLPQAAASAVFMPIGGRLFDRFGIKPLVITGMILIASGAFLISRLSMEDGYGTIIVPLIFIGAGVAIFGMSLNAHLMQSAPPNLVSRVSSLTTASQQVVGSFTVAGLATLLSSRLANHMGTGSLPEIEAWPFAFRDAFSVLMAAAIVGALIGFTIFKRKKPGILNEGDNEGVNEGV